MARLLVALGGLALLVIIIAASVVVVHGIDSPPVARNPCPPGATWSCK